MSSTAQDLSSKDQPLQEDALEEIFSMQSQTDADLEEILNLDEYIQSLPPELREKIYKEFVVIKMRERMEKGWYEVKEQIDCAPLCEKN